MIWGTTYAIDKHLINILFNIRKITEICLLVPLIGPHRQKEAGISDTSTLFTYYERVMEGVR